MDQSKCATPGSTRPISADTGLASSSPSSAAPLLLLKLRHSKPISKSEITSLGISPSSSAPYAFAVSLGTASPRSWIDVFDLATQQSHGRKAGSSAVFSPGGGRLAVLREVFRQIGGGVEHKFGSSIVIRDTLTGKDLRELKDAAGLPLAWSSNGRYLAAIESPDSFNVGIWDLTTYQRVARVSSHVDTVTHAVFTPSGALVTQSRDGTVRLTDAGKTLSRLEVGGHRRPYPSALAMTAKGGTVVSVWNTSVQQWIPETSAIVSYGLNESRRTEGWALCVSPDSRRIAFRTEDGFDILDASSAALLASQQTDIQVTAGAFTPNGESLLIGKMDGTVELWDIEDQ
ncbi:Quino protein amine dehydrogenase [Stachybotrys elegans]|uniref:Quino protein amine dehydrogenase n=1 Tax=Stachybotrys elegans TaxID=80388 RepID=A0A8K0T2T3_9HYPO|nr:Quino protein amine dehydrogenase [Stachybotrys elegans]